MTEVQNRNQAPNNLSAVVAAVASVLGITLDEQVPMLAPAIPILPTAVYDEETATQVTGVCYETRYRAVRAGRLVCRRVGSRRFYLGSDLLTWLQTTTGGRTKKAKKNSEVTA